ncbi:6595_t:CDS:1, partial [Paraglomus occultum]
MYLVQDAALSETSMISVESEAGLGNVHNGGNEANLNVVSEIAVEEIRKVDETTSKPVNGISGDVISFN